MNAKTAPSIPTFDPHINIKRIGLIGLGGTGSHVARILARMCYDLRQKRITPPQLLFIDGDKVEEKNVGRQMFMAAEAGGYKAEVLARRFSFSLGLEISYRNAMLKKEWFQHSDHYGANKIYYGDSSTVWIGAVDSHVGRQELSQMRGVWIDAGNHQSSGQVIIGNTDNWKKVVYDKMGATYQHMPTAALIYPQLLEPEEAPTLSCADRIIRDEQDLLVNDFMAAVVGQHVYKLLYRQLITSFMTFIDIENLAMRSIPVKDVLDYELMAQRDLAFVSE